MDEKSIPAMSELLNKPSSMLKWLTLPETKLFLQWVREKQDNAEKTLRSRNASLSDLNYAQGTLFMADHIIGLEVAMREQQELKINKN
jgi:hypothetical protein